MFIADLFHPVNDLAVECFLNGDTAPFYFDLRSRAFDFTTSADVVSGTGMRRELTMLRKKGAAVYHFREKGVAMR
jgi:hypothetical protein